MVADMPEAVEQASVSVPWCACRCDRSARSVGAFGRSAYVFWFPQRYCGFQAETFDRRWVRYTRWRPTSLQEAKAGEAKLLSLCR